ncbi:DnaB-like helicase C-terminal domain-containing protein, partial [Clostridium thermobutyricum]|uniref:DnaB-like helicase C-terminal domain-containing protein n=1 Tax=Clostridium thermobutyricum TaxID=29372 RepID=UPI002434D684
MNNTIKESEIFILGTILNNNNYILKSMEVLKEEDFYFTNHKFIYHSMIELYKKNIQFDSIILFNQLKKEGKGEIVRLYEISNISTYVAYQTFDSHIKLIKNNSLSKKLNTICQRAIQNNDEDVSSKIESLENELLGLKTTSFKDNIYKLSDVMSMTMEKIEQAYNSKNGFTGIATGLRKFDNAINGLQRKEFIVLGARPSMGKTALSLSLLENIKANVLYIQLDMSSEGMGQRMLASECYIPNGKVGRGKLTDDEWDKLGKGFN